MHRTIPTPTPRTHRRHLLAFVGALTLTAGLSACGGVDYNDPEAVSVGFIEAWALDHDCDKAAEFLDEDVQASFLDSCDPETIVRDLRIDTDSVEVDVSDDGEYADVDMKVLFDPDDDEGYDSVDVNLMINGAEEWEVVDFADIGFDD